MKKLITLLLSAVVLTFYGCVSKSMRAVESVVEPTGSVSAYLQGAYVSVDDAKTKLSGAGFEIVSIYKSVKKGKTIVFTCPTLKKAAAKPNRANVAVMRLFVDDQEKTISLTNPVYYGKSYMQKDYNHAIFLAVKSKLETAFQGLKDSVDKMKFSDLAGFRFSMGMPYYKDVKVIGEGSNADLLTKLKKYKKGENLVFELKLSDDITLVGYGIGKGTQRFVKKIGRANAGLLPWPVVVSGGRATMLQAEYYIAMNYPLLGIEQFSKIASVPGDVIKDLKKPFK